MVLEMVESGVHNDIVNFGARCTVNLGALRRRIGSTAAFIPDAPAIRFELCLAKLTRLSGATLPSSLAEVEAFVAAQKFVR